MAAKLAVAIITAAAVLVIGAGGLFLALVALNGYSEAQGGRILGGYVVVGLLTAAGAGVVSGLGYGALAGRFGWPAWAAAPASFVVTCACACAVLLLGFMLSLLVFGRVS